MRIIEDSGPDPGLATAVLPETSVYTVTIVVGWRLLKCPSAENRIQVTRTYRIPRV